MFVPGWHRGDGVRLPRDSWIVGTVAEEPAGSTRIPFNHGLNHLLLVAGVSGSGKSTFIADLQRRRLHPQIASALAPDVSSWNFRPSRESTLLRRWLGGPGTAPPRGQIFHCEITEPFGWEATGVEQRPRFYPVGEDVLLKQHLAAAKQISVVVVRASPDRLVRQLSERSALLHVPGLLRRFFRPLAPALMYLEGALPSFVVAKFGKIMGRRWQHRSQIRDRNARLVGLYAEPGAVDAIYRDWIQSLLRETGRRINGRIVYVEPAEGKGTWRFRLARDPHLAAAARLPNSRRKGAPAGSICARLLPQTNA
jgi:hypothetical protein